MKRKNFDSVLLAEPASPQALMQWHELEVADAHLAYLNPPDTLELAPMLSVLSPKEQAQANRLHDADERRHLILRRAFQRCFTAALVEWRQPLSELPLHHRRDQPPICEAAPQLTLTFSSSQQHYCACASSSHDIGIDIEVERDIANVEALAARFFTNEEAAQLAASPQTGRSSRFIHIWTAKEAGLKAEGLGIVDGLDRIQVSCESLNYQVKQSGPRPWHLVHPKLAKACIVAVVHRPRK
jgi:phosphopantetheinyl transferase